MVVCDMCGKKFPSEARNHRFFQVVRAKNPEERINNAIMGEAEYADSCSQECTDRFLSYEVTPAPIE